MEISEQTFPAGAIKFQEAELRVVLDIYADIANVTLELEPAIRTMQTRITLQNTEPITRRAALRTFEDALEKQAGIKMERMGSQHIKVNCPKAAAKY